LKALWAPVQEGVKVVFLKYSQTDNGDFWKALNIHVGMPQ